MPVVLSGKSLVKHMGVVTSLKMWLYLITGRGVARGALKKLIFVHKLLFMILFARLGPACGAPSNLIIMAIASNTGMFWGVMTSRALTRECLAPKIGNLKGFSHIFLRDVSEKNGSKA